MKDGTVHAVLYSYEQKVSVLPGFATLFSSKSHSFEHFEFCTGCLAELEVISEISCAIPTQRTAKNLDVSSRSRSAGEAYSAMRP